MRFTLWWYPKWLFAFAAPVCALLFCGAAPGQEKEESWTDRIKLKGDFRYRLELIAKDGDDTRYRNRLRLRAALHAKVLGSDPNILL